MGLSSSRSWWWRSSYAKGTPLPKDKRIEFKIAIVKDPSPEDLRKLEVFCSEQKLDLIRIRPSHRTVHLSGTVENINRAFKVDLRSSTEGYHGHSEEIQIPDSLKSLIVGMVGLTNRPVAKPYIKKIKNKDKTSNYSSYSPPDIGKLYNFPDGDGAGQTIALIELGGGYRQVDLDTYFKQLNTETPTIVSMSVDGVTNSPTGDPDGPDGEVVLDIEVAAAIAPKAKTVVYFAPNTEQGLYDAIIEAINDDHNQPGIISISWGAPEDDWSSAGIQSINAACQQAADKNVTVCVASGDNGSSDGERSAAGHKAHVDFPSSSPYVLACGGTRITVSDGKITDEVVWDDNTLQSATGGGVSEIFGLPQYQDGFSVPPSVNTGHHVGRGVPDLAADASPATGYQVRVDNTDIVVGGTSAVAPLYAALFARINSILGKNVGYFNPNLYQAGMGSGFKNITQGTNGSYSAGPGWNCCCGFGSPDGTQILENIRGRNK